MKRTLGGDRLGSGNKQQVFMHDYGKSNHDLGFVFKSTMASGTLVPFMSIPALPGDTFDIDLGAIAKTFPTVGPAYCSYKMQLDVFKIPIRLYNGLLHNSRIGVGLNMAQVKLPKYKLTTKDPDPYNTIPWELQQINPSSLLCYLGVKGVGVKGAAGNTEKLFNAIPLLAYWDIYKNYYSAKQECIGMYIDTGAAVENQWFEVEWGLNGTRYMNTPGSWSNNISMVSGFDNTVRIRGNKGCFDGANQNLDISTNDGTHVLGDIFSSIQEVKWRNDYDELICTGHNLGSSINLIDGIIVVYKTTGTQPISLKQFDLSNIDQVREYCLETKLGETLILNDMDLIPFKDVVRTAANGYPASQYSQQGLAVKTYQSDIFNNWLNNEYIDGDNGINQITALSTTQDYITINEIQLHKKIYDMLNRIAMSGGTYSDWLEVNWGGSPYYITEIPVYEGGLSKEIIFQEVISSVRNEDDPLGTLAGKGVMADKHKGGKLAIKIDEPSYIMGIASITPRICYSQGNEWDVDLDTMDDFHKPGLDGIGFQDLITERMAWWDTINGVKKSAGKQTAWLHYQTNFDKSFGDFANPNGSMFMTLNRRYERGIDGHIKDLTSYIDPSKYNYLFGVSSLDSQNFQVQIGVDIFARRVMSASQIPNL